MTELNLWKGLGIIAEKLRSYVRADGQDALLQEVAERALALVNAHKLFEATLLLIGANGFIFALFEAESIECAYQIFINCITRVEGAKRQRMTDAICDSLVKETSSDTLLRLRLLILLNNAVKVESFKDKIYDTTLEWAIKSGLTKHVLKSLPQMLKRRHDLIIPAVEDLMKGHNYVDAYKVARETCQLDAAVYHQLPGLLIRQELLMEPELLIRIGDFPADDSLCPEAAKVFRALNPFNHDHTEESIQRWLKIRAEGVSAMETLCPSCEEHVRELAVDALSLSDYCSSHCGDCKMPVFVISDLGKELGINTDPQKVRILVETMSLLMFCKLVFGHDEHENQIALFSCCLHRIRRGSTGQYCVAVMQGLASRMTEAAGADLPSITTGKEETIAETANALEAGAIEPQEEAISA